MPRVCKISKTSKKTEENLLKENLKESCEWVSIKSQELPVHKRFKVTSKIQNIKNSQIDSTLADLDRNRIFNLGLFDNVAWRLVPLENGDAKLQFLGGFVVLEIR